MYRTRLGHEIETGRNRRPLILFHGGVLAGAVAIGLAWGCGSTRGQNQDQNQNSNQNQDASQAPTIDLTKVGTVCTGKASCGTGLICKLIGVTSTCQIDPTYVAPDAGIGTDGATGSCSAPQQIVDMCGSQDCIALATNDWHCCGSANCVGFLTKDPSKCGSGDCVALVTRDTSTCVQEDCAAYATRNDTLCKTSDCTGLIDRAADTCASGWCKALASNDASLCGSKDCTAFIQTSRGLYDIRYYYFYALFLK